MIEKLNFPPYGTQDEWANKINELVDAVNLLQCKNVHIESNLQDLMYPKEIKCESAGNFTAGGRIKIDGLDDPYAEQRKWVGKICRFWNDDESPEDSTYGELVNIFDTPHEDCAFQCGYGEWYEHCEPVKPNDDIIFKGE